jgi:hypothetical protein
MWRRNCAYAMRRPSGSGACEHYNTQVRVVAYRRVNVQQRLGASCTMSNSVTTIMSTPDEPWSPKDTLAAFLWCIALVLTSLFIVSFPQQLNRWTAISMLLVPACGAFQTGDTIFPDEVFVDYYLRFILILSSHITWLAFREASTTVTRHTAIQGESTQPRSPWLGGYKLLFNSRGIGTEWEVPNLWVGHRSTAEITRQPTQHDDKTARPVKPTLPQRNKCSAVLTRIGYLTLNFTLLCLYYVHNPSSPSVLIS